MPVVDQSEQQAVPVAQEDREAAAKFAQAVVELDNPTKFGALAAQAFARHRLASLPCKSGEGAGEVAELIEMLRAAQTQDGCSVFDHTPEEFGLHIMENHAAVLRALIGKGPIGFVAVPMACTDEIAEVIAQEASCCGGIAETIWHKAVTAASVALTPDATQTREAEKASVGIFATDNSNYMRLTGVGKDDARLFDARVSRGAAETLMHEIAGLLPQYWRKAMRPKGMYPIRAEVEAPERNGVPCWLWHRLWTGPMIGHYHAESQWWRVLSGNLTKGGDVDMSEWTGVGIFPSHWCSLHNPPANDVPGWEPFTALNARGGA